MRGDSLSSGGGQVLEMSFQLKTKHLNAWAFSCCHLLELCRPRASFRVVIRGNLPWLQKVPVKSSRSMAQTIAPPKLFCLSHWAWLGIKDTISRSHFYFLEPRSGPAAHWRGTPYLDLKAFHIVITNPFIALIGIGYILRGVPLLSGSIFQEGTDLQKAKRFKSFKYDLYGRKHIHFFSLIFHFMWPIGVFLSFLIMGFYV